MSVQLKIAEVDQAPEQCAAGELSALRKLALETKRVLEMRFKGRGFGNEKLWEKRLLMLADEALNHSKLFEK